LGFPQRREQITVFPDIREPTEFTDIASPEFVMDHKGAGVDIPDWINQADHPSCAAHIQTR
jgi:hypothetical protein